MMELGEKGKLPRSYCWNFFSCYIKHFPRHLCKISGLYNFFSEKKDCKNTNNKLTCLCVTDFVTISLLLNLEKCRDMSSACFDYSKKNILLVIITHITHFTRYITQYRTV